MRPRAEARAARVVQCLAFGAALSAVWQRAWFLLLLLTVTILAADRWAHHAHRTAARPTHRRTA